MSDRRPGDHRVRTARSATLTAVRRLAWLMLGAAIGLAVTLLGYGALTAFHRGPAWGTIPVAVVLAVALGLVPGARELEVTAARAMLGSDAELIIPTRTRTAHRVQTVGWVLLHLALGMLTGVAIFAGAPAGALVIIENVRATPLGSGIVVPESAPGRITVIIAAVLVLITCLLLFWPLGKLATTVVGRILGPTAYDRLEVALRRAEREAEHTRLARELHDGIGHALTIVSVQAAAGRRVGERDPAAAAEAFAAIEDTSRTALAELDQLLGMLRADRRDAEPVVDLDRIIAAHREAGMVITEDVDLPDDLPPLLRRTVHRIVGEALTNAHRHGRGGPVQLTIHCDDQLVITVANSRGSGLSRPTGGRGLTGITERVTLFGGTVQAGPVDDRWLLRVVLPTTERDR